MRRCPSSSRWRIAWCAPDVCAAETEGPGSARREAPRAAVRGVAVLPDDPADGLAGLVRYVAAAVEHARDGRDRHPGEIGDLPDGQALGGDLGHTAIEACSGTNWNCFGHEFPQFAAEGLDPAAKTW